MDSPQGAVDGPQLLGLLALHHVRHRIGRLRVLDTGGILNNTVYHSNDTTQMSHHLYFTGLDESVPAFISKWACNYVKC